MGRELDFSGKSQLYYQVYENVKQDIFDNIYSVGSFLPTEDQLGQEYKVSRITIRKAMDLLVADGLITRKRGKGTFVTPQRMCQPLNKIVHFNEDMEKHGLTYSTKMLANEIIPADEVISSALNINLHTMLIHIARLRFTNDTPMCLESAYLPYDRCPNIYGVDFSKKSLRKTLQDENNIIWNYADQNIYAIKANHNIADLLNISNGAPVLYVERISFQKNALPGEYIKIYYRGDSYYFASRLLNS